MKSWQSEWGKFHHALRITVSENGLSEDMMVLKKETAFRHPFQWWIVVDILPLIQDRVWIAYALALVLLFCGFLSFRAVKKSWKA